jgi:hypothetical protein
MSVHGSSSNLFSRHRKALVATLSIALAGVGSGGPGTDSLITLANAGSVPANDALAAIRHRWSNPGHARAVLEKSAGSSARPYVAPRSPATRAVSSTADSGAGTLREALMSAVDGDVISMAGLRGSISLASALEPSASVTIQGPGKDVLTLDAGGHDRVLATMHSLALSDVTVANGQTPISNVAGGCILVAGYLTLTNATVTGCTAGGVATHEAAYGGGVFVGQGLTMTNTTVRDNIAASATVASGGGIYAAGYNNQIFNSSISGNSVASAYLSVGGGIASSYTYYYRMSYPGRLTITGSVISGNTASATGFLNTTTQVLTPGSCLGGGISSRDNLSLAGTSVTGNAITADGTSYGGGIYLGSSTYGYATGANLGASTIANNSGYSALSSVFGGGMMALGSATIYASSFSGNAERSACPSCVSAGGAIFSGGTAHATGTGGIQMSQSILSENSVTNVSSSAGAPAVAGGGIYASHFGRDTVALTNSTVSGNSVSAQGLNYANGGGLVANSSTAPVNINNSTIAFNTATASGGGMQISSTALTTLNSSIVANNNASYAADMFSDASVTVAGGFNLVMSADPGITLPANTIIATDPLLKPLAFNGGTTRTHALGAGSRAIDAGSNPLHLASDQRSGNFARVFGTAADIGAFELDDTIFANGFAPLLP